MVPFWISKFGHRFFEPPSSGIPEALEAPEVLVLEAPDSNPSRARTFSRPLPVTYAPTKNTIKMKKSFTLSLKLFNILSILLANSNSYYTMLNFNFLNLNLKN